MASVTRSVARRLTSPLMRHNPRATGKGVGGGGADVTAPAITSLSSVSLAENAALTHTLTANEAVTWTKTGGADAALFSLVGSTLSLTAKDYETPADADANNTYVVQVTATDGAGNATTQTITVTVTDVADTTVTFFMLMQDGFSKILMQDGVSHLMLQGYSAPVIPSSGSFALDDGTDFTLDDGTVMELG